MKSHVKLLVTVQRVLLLLASMLATPLSAAPPVALPGSQTEAGTTIDLSAEASYQARNDLARATVFAEASGPAPGDLAKKVNGIIADALKAAKGYSNVKVQSGAAQAYPLFGKGTRIDGWRMRVELALETSDITALSELLGKLQGSLAIASLTMLPSPEIRRQAEDEAMTAALAAFDARAKVVARAMGKPYRIRQLAIHSSGRPTAPVMRAATMVTADAAVVPIEAGDTQVSTTVSGQIELLP